VNPCALPRGWNFVHWAPIDGPGGNLAVTVTCTLDRTAGPNQMHSFQIVFDSRELWHFDPSLPPAPLSVDLWAVAAHEFGHATGRINGGPGGDGHFPEQSRLCPGVASAARHTMCPSYDLVGVAMRTLERHDIDAFRRAYGRR
jgi:hypothetical protein